MKLINPIRIKLCVRATSDDNADALAVCGASRHPDMAHRKVHLQAMRTTIAIHKMMIDILAAREERRRQPTTPENVIAINSGLDSDDVVAISSETDSEWSIADLEPD